MLRVTPGCLLVALASFVLAGCSGAANPTPLANSAAPAAPTAEDDAVREVFAAYVAALKAGDGDAAAALVTAESIAHYDTLLSAASTMPESELRARPPAERLAVLTLRARVPADQLSMFDGRGLFIHSVEQRWVGRHVAKSSLHEVRVDGDAATVRLEMEHGRIGEPVAAIVRDSEGWKFDLVAMLPHAAKAIEQTIARIDPDGSKGEDATILEILASVIGHEPGDELWIPPASPG